MCAKGCLHQGSLPTKLQAILADAFPGVFLLTGDKRSNRGLEVRQQAAHTASLGACAVIFPIAKLGREVLWMLADPTARVAGQCSTRLPCCIARQS